MSVTVENLDRIDRKLRRVSVAADQISLGDVAEQMRDEVQRLVPVVTGRLRDSITVERRGRTWVVKPGVPYAKVIEFGDRYRRAQAPFRRASKKRLSRRGVRAALRKNLREI